MMTEHCLGCRGTVFVNIMDEGYECPGVPDERSIADVYARTVDSLVRELRQYVPALRLEGIDVMTDDGLANLHAALRTVFTR